ncbi:glycosyltransferase family 2 protein [Nostoc sp. PA-18-2419]|uniref:glycosyltransferase family 2 protein n=1 Tax=Nostoc sp. PA-18-2419 TaxID=2575443 RepID=UPI001109D515|nr:glycosyltransferase family 2 protein [Nostoc sp. PA-18-2419]
MKISIVTPVYNSEKTLERTILSVINQNLDSELEYILIDGSSTDKTLEIIDKYSNKINIIVSEKDKGTYDAMNKGIALATGNIIGIINSDDWYNDAALKSVEQEFRKNPEVSIIHSPVKNYCKGEYLSTFIPGKLENMPFKFTIAHPSCFVKKQVYNRLGLFDLNYPMAADYDFLFRAYIGGYKFECLDTPLASFSLDGTTGKLTNKLRLIQESWRVSAKFVDKMSSDIKYQHSNFYINWFLRELATLPIKYFDPFIAIKIKGFIRRKIGKLYSDRYGAW